MKAPVGLLSDRTVCDSRWRGLAPTSSQMYIRLHCLLALRTVKLPFQSSRVIFLGRSPAVEHLPGIIQAKECMKKKKHISEEQHYLCEIGLEKMPYGSSVYDKLADLCDICAMEVDTPDGMISAEVRAETFLQWMEELKEKLGIPKYPDMIREEDVNQIVKWAQKEANPVYPVPEIWDAQEMKEFVLAMMEGARLEGAEKNE